MADRIEQYLDGLDQWDESDALADDLGNICERLDWLDQRLSDLEAALPLYALEDTSRRDGVARKLSELRNTISQVVYPRATPERRVGLQGQRLRDFVKSSAGEFPEPEAARLFVDVTGAISATHVTGIQRVVRELASRAGTHEGIPVFLSRQGAIAYDQRKDSFCKAVFKPGDVFFMPDFAVTYTSFIRKAMAEVSAAGGRNVALVHDLVPILFRATVQPSTARDFRRWFDATIPACDGVLCVSRAVAKDVQDHMNRKPFLHGDQPWVDWAHSGCDFKSPAAQPSAAAQAIISGESPFFLSVSTIEPRKGHGIALDAMERLWQRNPDVRYVIVGRYGWGQDALKWRMLSHPELGRRLFWLDGASDADLVALYGHARALIFASISEGFGLPVLEAAHFGAPSILSDIPVFRETAGDQATYFAPADSESLRVRLEEALLSPKRAPSLRMANWDDAADRFFEKVRQSRPKAAPAPRLELLRPVA